MRLRQAGSSVANVHKRVLSVIAAATLSWLGPVGPVLAHQPVVLGEGDVSPMAGPLLPDGTVSYAVRADVRRGDERGFRFQLDSGDRLAVQYLIRDAAPANGLPLSALPRVTLVDPNGRHSVMNVKERTAFFEPYSKTAYLYLSRTEGRAAPGTYQVLIRGRSVTPVEVTVAVGYREVPGDVLRQDR